jgi:hypothetical protein
MRRFREDAGRAANTHIARLARIFATMAAVVLCGELWAAPLPEQDGPRLRVREESPRILSCTGNSRFFIGADVRTKAEGMSRYMMFSAYNLEPYSGSYIDNALADLARHDVSGILYSSLGGIARRLKSRGAKQTEHTLNEMILDRGRELGASLWLQVREFENSIVVEPESQPRTVTAEEILSSRSARQAFFSELEAAVSLYNANSKSCVVVMFEEAGIYHSPQGGGTFWSSELTALKKRSLTYDQIFADRMVGLFSQAVTTIKSVNPQCSVGMHLGHSVFLNKPVLKRAMAELAAKHALPNFILYDFYLKAQRDFKTYRKVLQERGRFIRDELGVIPLHLAQLHTMNNFQHGLGKTPSRHELDRIVELTKDIGFRGIGFYTKNATPTAHNDNEPFSPNVTGQATIYQSAKDRWDYGLLKLREIGGTDFKGLFDVVLFGDFPRDDTKVEIMNPETRGFDLLGYVDPSIPKRQGSRAFVFRGLDARKYIEHGITLRLTESSQNRNELATLQGVWMIPSEPSSRFRTAAGLESQIRAGNVSNFSAMSVGETHLSADVPTMIGLCLK